MIDLKGVRVPDHFNGVGPHDTPGSEVATWGYNEAREHARLLREHGITFYKLFGGTTKVQRARAYVDEGIVVAMRFWFDKPWGRGNYSWVTPRDQVQMFADAGVQLFEPGWNEFNISCEWKDDRIPSGEQAANLIAVEVVNAWVAGLAGPGKASGVKLMFPSNTPGGNVPHRACYRAIVEELTRRSLLSTVEHLSVHPRPHNNPPDTKWSATNTVTWDEWRWIRDQFPAGVYLWATEHGYSLKDDQNHTFPQIDLDMWTEYNWELMKRMNPAHAKAIEPELAGFAYWFEAGWGHWGAWPKDALRDSIVPEMPAPSPLWIRMGERKNELDFSRYSGQPPVQEAMPGAMDLRSTLPRNGPYPQREESQINRIVIHHSGPPGWLQGVKADEYARRIARYHIDHWGWPGIGYTFVVGAQGLTCQCIDLADVGNHVGGYNTTSVGICLLGDFRAAKNVRPTDVQIAAAKNVISWIKSHLGELPIVGHKELNDDVCPGDTWEAWKEELTPEPIPPEEGEVKLFDGAGNPWTWEALYAKYGIGTVIETPVADSYWEITEIHEQTDGSPDCFVTAPPGTPVISYYTTAPQLDPRYNREWHSQGDVGISGTDGKVAFGMFSNYFPDKDPYRGPYEVWCGMADQHSEKIYIGLVAGTNHHHLRPTFVWHSGDGPPEPPDEDQLDRIEAKVNAIWDLLNQD